MARTIFKRRTLVLLALVVVAVALGKAGLQLGFWDGPIGG